MTWKIYEVKYLTAVVNIQNLYILMRKYFKVVYEIIINHLILIA